MIAVDSSVWVDHISGRQSAQADTLDRLLSTRRLPILVGDIAIYEVLCGFSFSAPCSLDQEVVPPLLLVSMLALDLVPRAGAHYQTLRRRGVTPGTVDMIIGTYSIEMGAELLTADRDLEPMRDHLGLRLWSFSRRLSVLQARAQQHLQ